MKQNAPIQNLVVWALTTFTTLVSSTPDSSGQSSSLPVYKRDPHHCDCFTVSGPDPGYFQHYKLWDFRAVPLVKQSSKDVGTLNGTVINRDEDWNDFDPGDEEDDFDDPVDHNGGGDGQPPPDFLYFFKTVFHKDWISQRWHRPRTPLVPVTMVNSRRNVFLTRAHDQYHPDATYLVLRTTRHSEFTSTAELETRVRNIWRCSLRVRIRILPSDVFVHQPPTIKDPAAQFPTLRKPIAQADVGNTTNTAQPPDPNHPPSGACAGIFTYHSKDCESDIEILTRDPPNRVRYANQPDYDPATDQMIPGASTIADISVPWTTWSTYRLDWHSDMSRWYVDGMLQDSKSYQVPNRQSRLVINLWSDGGIWTGDMKLGESIYLGIESIELAYNRSSDGNGQTSVPPEQRHGGHQVPVGNLLMADGEDHELEFHDPDTEIVTGVIKKKKKCKKGKRGDKCRKKQKHHKHHNHKGKDGNDEPKCQRICNIDEFHLGEVE